jgi:glycerol uptake facilitator-like aquaporin
MTTNTDYLVQFLVELIGTFIFLVVVISTGNPIAIGIVLIGLIFFGFFVTGGFYNPAITSMFFVANVIDGTQFILFLIAQFTGGILAYFFYQYFLKDKIQTSKNLNTNNLNNGINIVV